MPEEGVPTREQLKKLKVATLRQRLSKLSLPQGGLKDDLITRLLEYYTQAAQEKASEEKPQDESDVQEVEPEQKDDKPVPQEEHKLDEPDIPDNQNQPAEQQPNQQDQPVEQAPGQPIEQQPDQENQQYDNQDRPVEQQPAEQQPSQQGNQNQTVKEPAPPANLEQPDEQVEQEQKLDEQTAAEKNEEDMMEVEETAETVDASGNKRVYQQGEGGGEKGKMVEEEGGEKMELAEETTASIVSKEKGMNHLQTIKNRVPLNEDNEGVKDISVNQSNKPSPLMETKVPPPVTSENKPRPLMETKVDRPRPLMETKVPQVTSDYHSASDTNKDEEVTMATVTNNDKASVADADGSEGAKEQGKRKKKKKRRRRRHDQPSQPQSMPPSSRSKDKDKVEVEYIQEDILKPDDPYFRTFFRVFETFRIQEPEVKKQDTPSVSDLVAKAALESKRLAAQRQEESDEEEEGEKEQPKISKKKLRRMNRLSVAQLKQLVERPDVVEMHDVTAPDPQLLIHLKSTRNTVPVPRHWCFKRKYLQGKRGIEKPPFDLPDFIKATGVMEMRQALEDKEDAKSLKQKTRERVRPKMGKLTIDYQKLHDAFFKWQTKPKMSIHGDLYYEGKEFETRLRQKKPGDLSDELRKALGMPTGLGKHRFPPPWLVAMQRYGPPPSYPNLKIPGLNNPIPEGCSFGYFVGGWGKPPVDERGRPLYGDVFGLEGGENTNKGRGREEEEVDQTLWGELESEEEESESEEEEEEEEASPKPEDIQAGLVTPVEGLATPSGLTSIPAGLETPEMIQLRKKKIEEAMEQGGETPALYTVLPEKTASVGGAMMGSSHVYDVASAVPGALKKTSGSSHEGIEVTLDPSELDLDTATMSARYEEQLREQQGQLQKEDLSDMVAEHAAKQKKRKRPAADSGGRATKKLKEFKF